MLCLFTLEDAENFAEGVFKFRRSRKSGHTTRKGLRKSRHKSVRKSPRVTRKSPKGPRRRSRK